MPSVSSTDGNYQVYKRSVDELEDDYQKRKDRLEQKAKATESRLETNYNEATASHERSAEDATQRIRQNASDQVERSRLNERAESDRVKHEYYDRFGRSNGMEADKLKEQRDVAVSTIENLEKGHRSQLATADEEHHRKMAEGAVENERKLAEGTKTFRDSVMSSYEKSVADHKSEESRVKGEFTQKMGQNELDKIRDEKFHSSRADAAVRQAETGRQRDVARADQSAERRAEEIFKAAATDSSDTIARDRESHQRETQGLRDQLKDVSLIEGAYAKERGSATEAVTRQYETDARAKERMTISAYEDQVNGLQRKAKESDNYFNHLSSQTAKEKDAYFAGILQKTNQEAHAEQKGLENEFNRNLGQMRASVDKDQALSQKASEQQLTRANALAADSLEKQALVNQETLRNQKTQDSDKIKHLEGSIQNTKNSSDISEISPSVEENVRNYVAKGYEKNFQLERNRNRESEDIIRQTYTQKMHEVSAEKEQASTRSLRAQEALHHDEKSLLMAGIQDAEFTKDSTLRAKDQTAARSQDTLLRTYGQSLEHQKREYENIIDALRADSSTKLTAQRQESDFERKMAQRTFATQQNELIRESEKKLSDQKLEYESRFDLLKSQAQQAVQEAERRARTSLEEQGRNYEQRLTQLETQNKERERYTAQNYEDQLEKVKRSNALLIQKKS